MKKNGWIYKPTAENGEHGQVTPDAEGGGETQLSRVLGRWGVVLGVVLLAIVLAGLFMIVFPGSEPGKAPVSRMVDEQSEFRRTEMEARAALRHYLAARSPEERRALVLDPDRLRAFAPGTEEFGELLSEELFAVTPLTEEMRQHGTFGLMYHRQGEIGLESYPQPITTIEVSVGIAPADLLLSAANRELLERTDLGVRICAIFKKSEDGKYLLDWDIWNQTGARELEQFCQQQVTEPRKFRVLISAMHPAVESRIYAEKAPGYRWFWVADPFYEDLRYPVAVDGRLASATILRRPEMHAPEGSASPAATLELEWSAEIGAVVVRDFYCWGFEGLAEF